MTTLAIMMKPTSERSDPIVIISTPINETKRPIDAMKTPVSIREKPIKQSNFSTMLTFRKTIFIALVSLRANNLLVL